ncbi:MAG TPA: CRTAC1 family protein [Chthonomonadaceae bacterium]|nr:CRTAC1 family protein [Chthonomonadaceae bacterium]
MICVLSIRSLIPFARLTRLAGLAAPLLLIALAGCHAPSTAPHNAATAPPDSAAASPAPVSAEAPVKFVDITEKAGIHFRHQNSRTPRKYLIETMGSGCAFIDYDGDGWQDILLLNNRPIPGGKVVGRPTMALYHNNRNGTFSDVTRQAGLDQEMYAFGVAVGDYDNDGREDFYASCALGPGHLFHNEGGGRFKDVTAQAGVGNAGKWGTSCAWVDYDKDGKLDLFVCSYVKYAGLKDDQPCYASGGKHLVYCIPSAYETSSCTLYHNEGGGRFKDVTAESGVGAAKGKALGVSVWDYDGDGWPDLFVACDTVPGFLFHNLGNGKFQEIGVESGIAYDDEGNPHSGMGIDATDVNNDGKTILAITNYQGQQTSFYNLVSQQTFRDDRLTANIGPETSKVLGFGVLFFDYDNDGYKDMLQANGHVQDDIQEREPQVRYAQPTLLFHNQHNGTFQEVGLKSGEPFSKTIVGRGLAVGDIENNGRLAVLLSSNNGPAMLWRNETPTSNHWLALKLVGTKSNRDGIGALVIVTTGGVTQRAMVRSGSSYLSQSDLRPHFGLGAQTTADVEIRWPSGQVDKFTNVACDHLYTAHEGAQALTQALK